MKNEGLLLCCEESTKINLSLLKDVYLDTMVGKRWPRTTEVELGDRLVNQSGTRS